MKRSLIPSLFIFLLAPALLLSFTFKPDHTNFSGQWELNKDKSDLGQFADFAPHTIKADQTDDSITISRTAPSFNGGDNTTTETLTFDGKECESTLFGDSKKKDSLKWSDDGKSFTITYKLLLDFNGQQNEVNGTEAWSLSDDGKTLTLQGNSTSSFGDMSTKAIYEKQ